MKAVSKEGTDIYKYLEGCDLIQLIPSTDSKGEICLAFTNLGLLTIYFEWSKILCCHQLTTGDIYITEYSMKGVFITDQLETLDIEVYQNF